LHTECARSPRVVRGDTAPWGARHESPRRPHPRCRAPDGLSFTWSARTATTGPGMATPTRGWRKMPAGWIPRLRPMSRLSSRGTGETPPGPHPRCRAPLSAVRRGAAARRAVVIRRRPVGGARGM